MTVERDWFWFYYALWLASVFTLVLVLRQSSENRSIINQSCEIIKLLTNKKLEIVQKGDTPHEIHVFHVLLYLQEEYP